MTSSQRLLLVVAQIVIAVGLASSFVEWRAEDRVWSAQAGKEVPPPGLIFQLGTGKRVIGFKDDPKAEIETIAGIFALPSRSEDAAAFGGILIPVLLLISAAYFALGSRR